MKTIVIICALCGLVFAETTENSAQREAATQLAKVSGVEKNIEDGFTKMMPIIEKRAASLGLNEEKKKEFINIYQTWFEDDIDKEKMVSQTIDLYCETFTAEELIELTKFHQTDLGKKFISKLPELNRKTTGYGIQEGQEKQPKLLARLKPFLEENAPEALSPPASAEAPSE